MTKGILIFFVGISVLLVLMNGAANWIESQSLPEKRKFEIVDTYNGCSVVRYSPDLSSRYSYFLDCRR